VNEKDTIIDTTGWIESYDGFIAFEEKKWASDTKGGVGKGTSDGLSQGTGDI